MTLTCWSLVTCTDLPSPELNDCFNISMTAEGFKYFLSEASINANNRRNSNMNTEIWFSYRMNTWYMFIWFSYRMNIWLYDCPIEWTHDIWFSYRMNIWYMFTWFSYKMNTWLYDCSSKTIVITFIVLFKQFTYNTTNTVAGTK